MRRLIAISTLALGIVLALVGCTSPAPTTSAAGSRDLPPGWGEFKGTMKLTMMKLATGELKPAPFPTFHQVNGFVFWKDTDGSIRSSKVNALVPWEPGTAVKLYDSTEEESGRGFVLLKFDYSKNATYYRGPIQRIEK